MEMNKIVGSDVLISYLKFSERFIVYAYSSEMQLGRVISSKWESLAFYSHKLNPL